MFQEQSDTDGGKVAVGHFFISQHSLQESLQMSLRRLQALPAPRQIGDVRSPLPVAENITALIMESCPEICQNNLLLNCDA